jgi:hypothetical protein
MISNGKTLKYKVLDTVESYNFHIWFISVRAQNSYHFEKKKKNVKKRKKSWKNTSGGVDAGELRPAHPSRRHRRPPRTSAGSRLHRGGRFRATHRIHEVSLCSPFFTSNRWHYLIIHPNC